MPRLLRVASLLAVVAGCQAVSPAPAPTPIAATTEMKPASPPQLAAPVVAKPASTFRLASATAEPPATPDALSLAADCLDRGDDAAAANHLARHLGEHPDQVVFRAQLADLLARLDRLPEAQAQLETATADAQDGPPMLRKDLVRYHTRLMEIARQREDAYAEHLHRGIGLYLVAVRLEDTADVERLLFKAAAALKEARAQKPDEARPEWYLYQVWMKLDQARPAEQALRKAAARAPFTRLTPAESRELALATMGPGPLGTSGR